LRSSPAPLPPPKRKSSPARNSTRLWRSPAAYYSSTSGVPVVLNIQADDLEKHLAEIPKGKPLVLVSNHAHRAGIAADLLESKGFKIAGAIGAQVYESEGGTLIKYLPEKPAANAGK
jgi:rhodanese-related sulfurtransferase